ncbi:MAG: sulfotransferase family protein [Vicinamibacterales bacterium]
MSPAHQAHGWGRPVFVVGSARSGNTLLYHTLLSAGGFAIYRGEPAVFDLLAPRFGDLRSARARQRLLETWPRLHLARTAGLNLPEIRRRVHTECRSNGDFLRIVLGALARAQGAGRWAVWGPDNLLYMRQIKRELPDALFVHMIRDGRDVALSMSTEGWIRPFPWDRSRGLLAAALHWFWKVGRGRAHGRKIGPSYLEIRFEELVTRPRETLGVVSGFIEHDLDPDRIQQAAVGTLRRPNSTFSAEGSHPVERWRERLAPRDLERVEMLIGSLLSDLGYQLASASHPRIGLDARMMRYTYPSFFELKQRLRSHWLLGRWVAMDRLRLASGPPPARECRNDAAHGVH